MRKIVHGGVTLSLIMLLSSALCLFLLIADKRLSLFSFLSVERQLYVTNSLYLQTLSQQEKQTACNNLVIEPDKSVQIVEIKRSDTQAKDAITHYFYCKHLSLFKMKPSKKIHEKAFGNYVSTENARQYQFNIANKILSPTAKPQLYWVGLSQSAVEISGKVEGVIIAEGDLTLSSAQKTHFRGSIITGGNLTLQNVTVTYDKNIVLSLFQQYTKWQVAMQSWRDFNVEDIKND